MRTLAALIMLSVPVLAIGDGYERQELALFIDRLEMIQMDSEALESRTVKKNGMHMNYQLLQSDIQRLITGLQVYIASDLDALPDTSVVSGMYENHQRVR